MKSPRHVRKGKQAAALALTSAVLVTAGLMASRSPAVAVATDINLGDAASFSVLGGSAVTNTGPSVISGDLGVSPGSSITGVTPEMVGGTVHENDAEAAGAQADLTIAYNNAAGQASDANLTGEPAAVGGLTLVSGVYTASTSAQLTGTLTLDAQGNPDAVFVFQIGSTLTTASNSTVLLVNEADPCHVFWQVGSSATIGTGTTFVGTIMALTSVTVTTGASIDGRALARNGAVTLDTNRITTPDCSNGGGGVDTDVEGTDVEGTGTDVEGSDVEGSDVEGTDVEGTDVEGTDVEGSDVEGTDVEGTDVEGTGTDVEGTDVEGTGTDVEGTDVEGTGTDVEGTDVEGTDVEGTDVEGTDVEGTDVEGTGTGTEGTGTNGTETTGTGTGTGTTIPKGHPRTGLGGTARDTNPYSSLLLVLGGVSGTGSAILAAQSLRRGARKDL